MNLIYSKTRDELYDLQKFAIKLGLENISALSAKLGNPHAHYPVIHIAGTNGKGSTARILHQILLEHGLRCGLFTSPHLFDFRERIRVNDELIPEQAVIDFWQAIRETVYERKATFFDTTTAMAMYWFDKQKVDVAIFETGLGGRLDSTNIVKPEAVVITPIGFDHEKQLGNDLARIAAEKAAIIKPGCHFYSGKQDPRVMEVLLNKMEDTADRFWLQNSSSFQTTESSPFSTRFDVKFEHDSLLNGTYRLNLPGRYQVENAVLAMQVAKDFLNRRRVQPQRSMMQKALLDVSWPGRLQCIRRKPNVFIDVSHNSAGMRETADFIHEHFQKQDVHLLIGVLRDKDVSQICKQLSPVVSSITVSEPDNERKMAAEELASYFAKTDIRLKIVKDVKKAYEISVKGLNSNQTLIVTGSHFLVSALPDARNKKHLT